MAFIEFVKATLLGIIEGITEWLPVSSTGHMILFDELLRLDVTDDFKEMFLVVIQLGAILAVPILFWDRLWPFSKDRSRAEKSRVYSLWLKVIVGALPAAVVGALLDDILDTYLYNHITVSVALIIYGIAFILVESLKSRSGFRIDSVYDITYADALRIGAFQVLSLIPGTSRSGATILGALLIGVARPAGAEFTFFLAIPVMVGASGIKALGFLSYVSESAVSVPTMAWVVLLVGCAVSFAVSMAAIRFLMDFVKKHSFAPFGVYRIALGALVLIFGLIRG